MRPRSLRDCAVVVVPSGWNRGLDRTICAVALVKRWEECSTT
jgi:hypothetical protein